MGILRNIFGGGRRSEKAAQEEGEQPCSHDSLTPRWERREDMGNEELATYVCELCGERMSYERAKSFLNRPEEPGQMGAEAPRVSEHERK